MSTDEKRELLVQFLAWSARCSWSPVGASNAEVSATIEEYLSKDDVDAELEQTLECGCSQEHLTVGYGLAAGSLGTYSYCANCGTLLDSCPDAEMG